MERAIRAVGGVFYALLRLVLGSAVRLYYRRIEFRHAELLPPRGPLLVVANHPASLTDVLVLGAAVPRRLHFVAYSGLFAHPLLGFALRLAGTVPVYRHEDAAEQMHRNVEMFAECNRLLREGGAVLIFPEGTSRSDRKVERLKTGAARMALAYEFAPEGAGDLVLLPIGLHFEERTAFRSDVLVTAGVPIPLADLREPNARDPAAAVRELTDRIQGSLEKLILNVPSAELAQLVRDIERLYLDDLREATPGAAELTLARGIADAIEFFRRNDPVRLHRIWVEVTAYRRKLAALDLRDQAVRELGGSRATAPRLVATFLVGAPFALAGALLNWLPYRLCGPIGQLFAPDPTRVAFARIVCGVVLFPLAYAGVALALRHGAHWGLVPIAALLAASIPLGLASLGWFGWLRRERHRLRLTFLLSSNRPLVARLRLERRRIVRMLDAARKDYQAGLAVAGEGSTGK
ncbi:MAG: 1-acyl-sn-glycerol-3-phosphate acyltransferase [Candidatus Eisenbacteria bacterium]|nr:1-acyl-sn-glycerol-3-phosphate acyltransferase [Candidatus Eisenbacteria bacterium]